MQTFTSRAARENLRELIALVEDGEDVVITQNGRPAVKVTTLTSRDLAAWARSQREERR